MKQFKLGRSTGRVAIAAAVLTLAAGPVTAAIWRLAEAQEPAPSAESTAALTIQVKATVTQTANTLAGQALTPAEAQAVYVTALEGAIIASGAAPQVAIDALIAAREQMKAAGTLSAPAEAAINQVIDRIRQTLEQDAPAATGADTGAPAFGAPPVSGSGGGGPDYDTAA